MTRKQASRIKHNPFVEIKVEKGWDGHTRAYLVLLNTALHDPKRNSQAPVGTVYSVCALVPGGCGTPAHIESDETVIQKARAIASGDFGWRLWEE